MVAERLAAWTGDALSTEELLALRWEQRRIMRLVPMSIFMQLSLPDVSTVSEPDLAGETALREEARAFARVLERDMPRLRTLALAEAAIHVLQELEPRETSILGETLREMVQRAERIAVSDVSELQTGTVVVGTFVALGIVADALAGDGYEDPRLRR